LTADVLGEEAVSTGGVAADFDVARPQSGDEEQSCEEEESRR
jgi:hypothetical protein